MVRPPNVSTREWRRHLKARAKASLFADDPAFVEPPRPIGRELEDRERMAREFRERMRAIDAEMLRRAKALAAALRRAGAPAAEVRRFVRPVRGLGPAYVADALRRALRARGLEGAA